LNAGKKQAFIPVGIGLLGDLYLRTAKDPVKAEATAREVLEYSPHFANAHFTLGRALAAQRRFAEAREAYQAAIEDGAYVGDQFVVDNEVPLWKAPSEIGGTLMEEGAYDLALAWFEIGLKNRPRVQPVRLNRARALEKVGRNEEAETAFREVWEDDRDDLAANEYLNFLLRRGREREALAMIDALSADVSPPTRLILYGSAAAVARRLGDEAAGNRYLDAALALDEVNDKPGRLDALFLHYGDEGLRARLREVAGAPAPQGKAP
ncbi:MAG: tetratricopeptide repeat protein, partial [Candidatus Eremiobacteraeota bacterium]|nr:tetratricopeptide repeat protein [Candidatus Eremiobacteraeota bacterium]